MAKPRQEDKPREETKSTCGRLFKTLAVLTLVLAIAVGVLLNLGVIKPVKARYYKMAPVPPLEGNLKQNDKLSKAVYIAHKRIIGPETIVFSPNGSMYSGLANGHLVRIDSKENIHKVVQVGAETNEQICNKESNAECGRALGLRMKPNTNFLYGADVFNGIFKVNLETGTRAYVLSRKDPRFGSQPPNMFNDLDFDGDTIYFIDSSKEKLIGDAFEDLFELAPNGRLFRYNEKSDQLELLLEGLYFPNGVQLSPSKDAVFINECAVAKISKFYLSGPKKGQKEVWANLPGFGDTIRLTERQTMLVPIAGPRHGKLPSIADIFGEYPLIRSVIGTIAKTFNRMDLTFSYTKYGLLAEYDLDGNVLKSWHDPTGEKIEMITNAQIHGNKIYLGSVHHDYIGVVDYD